MRVAFTGGRDYQNDFMVAEVLAVLNPSVVLLEGGATGLDSLVREVREAAGFAGETFEADWSKHGKAAGPIRNREMLDSGADILIAFPGGKGTEDCVKAAKERGIPVLRLEEKETDG